MKRAQVVGGESRVSQVMDRIQSAVESGGAYTTKERKMSTPIPQEYEPEWDEESFGDPEEDSGFDRMNYRQYDPEDLTYYGVEI